ncbi:unnamed protein product [Ceutorhynchus assimilis]|uniref:CHK kinase-like domain-containing protein n=1 Tax=Ceutorhynchus assimilis TaxID=467358 RepID=A0A9P0DHS6_9CUCU|nr:unnamed protein product [Ceutorhynchus assimilis]
MANKKEIEKLEDLIKGTIDGELVEQQVSSLLPPGENYGSVMYKVDFKVKTSSGEIKEYHAVAKCTPLNQVTQEMFNTQVTFKSEIAWYTTVIPTLKSFAKEQGLRRELDFFQQFYGARISLDPESDKVDLDGVILTENLKYLGYGNVDRHVGFEATSTISILKDLATFHAIPLAIKIKNPELFAKKLVPYCPDIGNGFTKMKPHFDQKLIKSLKEIPELTDFMPQIARNIEESSPFGVREIREPWAGIMHLDFWCNNIMATSEETPKVMILDLQVPKQGSVAADLIFFLLTSVKFDVIKDRLDEFVELYYEEFIENLRQLKVDTSDFKLDGLLEEITEEVKKAEFRHSLSHSYQMLMNKGVAHIDTSDAKFKQENFDAKPQGLNERQIEKLRWISLEVLKRNWIL